MSIFTASHEEVDGPGFDQQRLDPDRVPRVLELTNTLCAVNEELSVRSRPSSWRGPAAGPADADELVDRRRRLLDELHRLIAS